ncbi:MAG: quinon protein alcohol dehydrogenase-like superfamily [Benniella sp.]|nr:MAG: quinon protein alcohol dehydrogenase-like superfamily [Benniella sp.]
MDGIVRNHSKKQKLALSLLFVQMTTTNNQQPTTNNREQMVFGNIISSPRASLSLQQVLRLANVYLENARKESDPNIALVLCYDTEVSLKKAKHTEDKGIREGIASIYIGLGELLSAQGHREEARAFYKKSEKWGGRAHESGRLAHPSRPASLVSATQSALHTHSTADSPVDKSSLRPSSLSPHKQETCTATVPKNIFPTNVLPPTIAFNPPEPDSRLNDTRQLACCLGLLQASIEPDDILDIAARNWLQITKNEPDEKERLSTLATDVIRAFKRDEFKNAKSVTEVVFLAPVLENDDFRYLVREFYSGIDQSGLLDVHQLEGLAHLIQSANSGYLDTDDLVKVLTLLSTRLRDTHHQSTTHLYQLTCAVSHVLDAMADANVKGLNREKIHEPLSSYLDGLKESSDPYLVYQAAYAYQALLCVPDDETLWQATLRRTGKVIQGVSGLVSAVKGLDLNGFIEGLENIQKGLAGATEMVQVVKTAYDGAKSLTEGGRVFFDCLKEGLSFSRKCAWYPALRGADTLIRNGEVAANSQWDTETRQGAIVFLCEIYQNDTTWGDQATVKQWIVNILVQLTSLPGSEMQFAEARIQELRKHGDTTKQAFYRTCLEKGSGSHPLRVILPEIASPSLLDRVQERPVVEGSLRQLRRLRLKERGNAVYIPPQAKSSLQSRDEARFPLMEKVNEFLSSEQKVFLLLGDSGAGKSTFNRELECHLWQMYRKTSAIPLYINLPAIDKPEHDMIAKQLRKAEFTEPQIRELKLHRKFTLICDGYDESQQTQNLYSSNRLNQPGEWSAKMVISCRSEYLGVDYRDRFQPGNRNQQSDSSLFQEAVITPFSMGQVQDYITQYVSVHQPLWEADEYKKALDLIPSLKELVKNPFLMSLSLEVLPRMVDPGHDLSATHITRMALYDQFIEHWLERGKKRLGEKNLSPQARSAYESLSDEGFTRNGIDYLKKLSVAIYKEQDGQPIVTYSRYKDENTWKASFFSREEEKQLLREACPLIRNGNQHRFIHRSLLEYGVALAIFDPQDWKERMTPESTSSRRRSVCSIMSTGEHGEVEEASGLVEQEVEFKSPLAWRSFISEPSLLQFLEERVQQEPLFKQHLLAYIERSKDDKKWRTAAANAITVLIRSGYQFNSADLRGIRVPNANLSYGVFDSAQLQGADLRRVDLRGAWLQKADLSKAQMVGAQFGELPFLKQERAVEECAYSPDGSTFALRLESGKILVYLTSNWETLWTLNGDFWNIMYSPTGHQIASGSEDGAVRLWDVGEGTSIHILKGHAGRVTSIAYSPGGDQIASSSRDMTVRIWDVRTGNCRHIWIGHTTNVSRIIYSPKDNQIASYGGDSTVRLWNIDRESCLLRGHGSSITSIVYSPHGDQIASTSYDRTLRLWDVSTGECRHVLGRNHSGNKSIRLWDVETWECLHTLQGHNGFITKITYSPQGDVVASASDDKTVRLWDAETGVCRQTLRGHSGSISSVVFSPRGDQVASQGTDNTVRLWDVRAGMSRHISGGHDGCIWEVHSSPRGDYIATCSSDGTVRIRDVETGLCRQTLRGHSSSVYHLAYSPRGDQIATCGDSVRLWNIGTGACSHTLSGHSGAVFMVAYSPQGDRFASASQDTTVRLWDVRSGECHRILIGHTSFLLWVMYSPNGTQVVSCSHDSTVRIWDVESGVRNHTLIGHSNTVNSAAYSPQGNQIVSASDDTTVRVWDVQTGECQHILIGHSAGVYRVAYSPKGDQITSGGWDGSMRVWDLEVKTCLWTLTGHTDRITKIIYSSREDLVVSACVDKSVRVWDVASGQCRVAIQDFQESVMCLTWIETSGASCLVAGCSDGSTGMWQVRTDDDRCSALLRWRTTTGELVVKDATIQDVQGLDRLDRQLLEQRGAVGEPAHRLRDASKKLGTMVSVVSKLKTLSDRTEEHPALTKGALMEELEQRFQQMMEMVAASIP